MPTLAFIAAVPVRPSICSYGTFRERPTRALSLQRRRRTRVAVPVVASLKTEVGVAVLATLTVGLSWCPLSPLVPEAAIADVAAASARTRPAPELVVSHEVTAGAQSVTGAVIGVAKAPIHEYHIAAPATPRGPLGEPRSQPRVVRAADSVAEEARREFVLAARLVTAVLLGVMVGVERRATRLNLGVRSITSITVMSTLLFVVLTTNGTGAVVWPALMAVPAVPVLGAGVLAAAAVYVGARLQTKPPREMVPMSVVVGLAVTLGGACGAGLSLMTAGCYLGAISLMRASGRGVERERMAKAPFAERELRVRTDDGWDADRRMVLRIGTGPRVVEVGGEIEGSELSM